MDLSTAKLLSSKTEGVAEQQVEDLMDEREMLVEREFQSPNYESDRDELELWCRCREQDFLPPRASRYPSLTNNSSTKPSISPCHSHLDSLDVTSLVETHTAWSAHAETCSTTFLTTFASDVSLKSGRQTPVALRKVPQRAGLEWNRHNMCVDAVAQLGDSSRALEMVLPCSGDAHSRLAEGSSETLEHGHRQRSRKNQQVKLRQMDSVFKIAKERKGSNWLANLVTLPT